MKKEFYCYNCPTGRVFTYAKGIDSHNDEKHSNIYVKGTTKTCKFCRSWLKSQAELDVHIGEKHKPGWEPHLSETAKKAAEKKKK